MSNAKDLLGKAGTSGPLLPKPAAGPSALTPPAEHKEAKPNAAKDAKGAFYPKPQSQPAAKTTGTVRPKV